MDIVSVNAIGEEGLGMMAVVTFRGNIQKALGRGDLKQGLVAMLLPSKNQSHTPAVLATRGTAIDSVFRKTRSEEVGAVRSGRQLSFFIDGDGYSTVANVTIESFANLPVGSVRRTSAGPPTLSDEEFKEISTLHNLDKLVVLADAKQLTCEQLEKLNKGILFYISALTQDDFRRGREPAGDAELKRLVNFQVAIKTRLDDQCGNTPKTPEGEFAWTFFGGSTNEVTGKGSFGELSGRKVIAITIRTPGRDIDAALCPSQLPTLTFLAKDTIKCGGGELPEGSVFTANVRTDPSPAKGMESELTATLYDGTTIGPFTITGPDRVPQSRAQAGCVSAAWNPPARFRASIRNGTADARNRSPSPMPSPG